MLKKGAQEKKKYMERLIGSVLEIIPEYCLNGYTEGYSENYVRVYVEGEIEKCPTQVCVETLFKDGVLARVVKES